MELSQYSSAQLKTLEADLTKQYQLYQQAGLKLDLTRGKPSSEQLVLSDVLDGILAGDYTASDGTDVRNYGGLDGLPEMKALAAEILDAKPEDVLIGGNASLTLMHQYLSYAWFAGVSGEDSAWQRAAGRVKFICPVPG
ncbi:MAG: aminotransferase, partial [Pseudomonadota bacterium]